jgi:hypothetical protein
MRIASMLAIVLVAFPFPATADPELIFTLSNIGFNAGSGFSTGAGASMSVEGIGTPLNAGVTRVGGPGGFNFNPHITSSDANYWYLGGYSSIVEAGFDLSGSSPLAPGDIGTFFYYPFLAPIPPFAMAKTGGPLSFEIPLPFIPVDPRIEAFYGLAPPCPVDPFQIPLQCLSSPFDGYWQGTFSGAGSALDANGVSMFTGTIVATSPSIPEPSSVLLLAPIVVLFYRSRSRSKEKPSLRRAC